MKMVNGHVYEYNTTQLSPFPTCLHGLCVLLLTFKEHVCVRNTYKRTAWVISSVCPSNVFGWCQDFSIIPRQCIICFAFFFFFFFNFEQSHNCSDCGSLLLDALWIFFSRLFEWTIIIICHIIINIPQTKPKSLTMRLGRNTSPHGHQAVVSVPGQMDVPPLD